MSSFARDETDNLDLQFNDQGLIPAIATDVRDGTVLMFAYMNKEALETTLSTGELHFFSRSRNKLWKKGETSGEVFAVEHVLVDCDQDVLQIQISPLGKNGVICHTGRRSCFYREIRDGRLVFVTKPI